MCFLSKSILFNPHLEDYLLKFEVRSKALDVLTRQFRKVFEVIDGSEFDLLTAKRVDCLRYADRDAAEAGRWSRC